MSLPAGYTLRPATLKDIAAIALQREGMWRDIVQDEQLPLPDAAAFAAYRAHWQEWLREMIPAGTYTGWLALHGSTVVGGAGLLLRVRMPLADDLGPIEGYLLNIYTDPQHRGYGLGKMLTQAAMQGASERGVRAISLSSSPAGRRLYEALGFRQSGGSELRLTLPEVTV
jgi:ribosomal protein S18 acetylase RimI-like enzyme